jgi:pSer/pThr/pTyr-binding forkhead associated (FHA) protein
MSEHRFVLRKAKTGEERELTGVMPVGREVADGGLKLVEEGGSRRHATLSVSDGTAFVEDSGSRNGTYINDKPVTAKTALKKGDLVRFDKEVYEFRVDTSEPTVFGAPKPADKVAGAWVDWNTSGSDGTERFTSEQLADYLRKAKLRQANKIQSDFKEPCLTVAPGTDKERVIALTGSGETQEWAIGRGAECAIRFDEGDVSEWHAKIVREGQKWKLIDAISSNGSFVNDLRVGMSYLSSGDNLRFGRTECVFHLPGSKKSSAPSLDSARPGARMSRNKIILIALTASFVVTLLALYLFIFRTRM